jgi:branched-subunit amino acid aminotransferase/4-amino-4-deoxychorismate lyase
LTPERNVLRGVSREFVAGLATTLGLTLGYTRITPEELSRANEAFITSTPHCLLPVTRFNHEPIGNGTPGPVFQRLISAWSEKLGIDIVEQMRAGAKSRSEQ